MKRSLLIPAKRRSFLIRGGALTTAALAAPLLPPRLAQADDRAGIDAWTTEPGRPILYGTTKRFLELFGLNSLKDLPQSEGSTLPPVKEPVEG